MNFILVIFALIFLSKCKILLSQVPEFDHSYQYGCKFDEGNGEKKIGLVYQKLHTNCLFRGIRHLTSSNVAEICQKLLLPVISRRLNSGSTILSSGHLSNKNHTWIEVSDPRYKNKCEHNLPFQYLKNHSDNGRILMINKNFLSNHSNSFRPILIETFTLPIRTRNRIMTKFAVFGRKLSQKNKLDPDNLKSKKKSAKVVTRFIKDQQWRIPVLVENKKQFFYSFDFSNQTSIQSDPMTSNDQLLYQNFPLNLFSEIKDIQNIVEIDIREVKKTLKTDEIIKIRDQSYATCFIISCLNFNDRETHNLSDTFHNSNDIDDDYPSKTSFLGESSMVDHAGNDDLHTMDEPSIVKRSAFNDSQQISQLDQEEEEYNDSNLNFGNQNTSTYQKFPYYENYRNRDVIIDVGDSNFVKSSPYSKV